MSSELSTRAAADRLYEQALDFVANGDHASAASTFRKAIALDPGQLDAMHGLVRVLQDLGAYDQALGIARELIALDPDDPLAHTSLSILYQHQGMVPEAEAAALKAKLLGWKRELLEFPSGTPPPATPFSK